MRLLLDSHALLWWSTGELDKLPTKALGAMQDEDIDVFVSVASLWELSIKYGLGKLPEAERFIADLRTGAAISDFTELAIERRHAVHAGVLEIPHKDSFDRMLIAQAQLEGLSLVSNERLFDRFGVSRLWD